MALTNYRAYKWLIDLLDEAPDQRFGMTHKQINREYERQYDKIYNLDIDTNSRTRTGITERKKVFLKNSTEETTLTYKTLINWRNAIWKEFGLIVWHPVIKKKVNKIIKGVKTEVEVETKPNTYILVNRELLDENKTLRETLEHLVEDERRGYVTQSPFSKSNRTQKSSAVKVSGKTMGFVSAGSSDVDYLNEQLENEPELLGIIQFAMTFGEALVIEYGKSLSPDEKKNSDYKKDEPFVFEPQQLKQINGRWYVAGYLYSYGNRETLQTVIYDVERLNLWEGMDDIEIPSYTLNEGFDITSLLPSDRSDHFDPDRVVSVYMRTTGSFLDKQPFCEAQEKVEEGLTHNLYKMYVKPNDDFFIRYMAYGDELQAFNPFHKIERTSTDITDEQIQYLRSLRKQGL